MNKKGISAFVFTCLTMFQVSLFAQDNNEAETLFGSGNPMSTKNLGFFIAPSFSIGLPIFPAPVRKFSGRDYSWKCWIWMA
jgi:hypothetical protein